MTGTEQLGGAVARISRISRRVAAIEESVTLAVDARAKALRASGKPVIVYGAGEPDFPTPAHIVEAASRACLDPVNHRYTPAGGLPSLKEAIVAKTARDSRLEVTPAEIVVTNGGKQAIYEALATVLEQGDEVLLPAPYWTTYPEAVRLAGATPVPVVASEETGYRVTLDQLEAAFTPRSRLLVFVSPSNPTGAVYPPEEVEAIGRWAVERGLWVLTDEIYEHFVYDGIQAASMPAMVPELRDSCIIVNGVAKAYAMTGWRLGWAIAPKDVAKGMTTYQSHATSNVNNIAQIAAIAALTGDLSDSDRMRKVFDVRRQIAVERLNAIPGVVCPTPQGAFYVYPNVKGLIGSTIGGVTVKSSLQLTEVLLDQINVALVPGEAFGTPGYVRLSYALADGELVEGLERMARHLS